MVYWAANVDSTRRAAQLALRQRPLLLCPVAPPDAPRGRCRSASTSRTVGTATRSYAFGKRERMRQAGIWRSDPREYFEDGKYLVVSDEDRRLTSAGSRPGRGGWIG